MNHSQTYISEKVKDGNGDIINPSTIEKQDEVISVMETVEGNQDTQTLILDALFELVSRLEFLSSIRGVLSDIRTNITGGTVNIGTLPTLANVTTLSTLTNQSQIGGLNANTQVPNAMNTLVEVSNIRNIVIS